MKITPLEIRNQQFDKTNFRGYNIEEVESFLGNLALEWERIVNESIMLRMQLDMAEKEAAKFREIQMTLIKTLKTAEDTGNMITEQANLQAEKSLQEAADKSEQILTEAYAESNRLKVETEQEISQMKEGVSLEIQDLERNCRTLEHYRNTLLVQLKTLANTTLDHVDSFDVTIPEYTPVSQAPAVQVVYEPTPVAMPEVTQAIFEPEVINEKPAPPIAEPDHHSLPSEDDLSVGEIESREVALAEGILAHLKAEAETPLLNGSAAYDDFTAIEGISPQIHQALIDSGITTFRALSCLPAYKVFEFLHKKGVGNDEFDIHGWTQHAYRLSGGQMILDETPTAAAEEDVAPIVPVPTLKKEPVQPASGIDFEDKTSKIIQSIRSNMQMDGKTNGKARKEGDVSRLEDLLKARKKDQNSGSFFDNL